MASDALITSKVFQAHFTDADYHLDQAESFHSIVEESFSHGPLATDQVALAKARAHSRACIIAVIAGTESLCHCIEGLLGRRKLDEIPSDWVPRKLRNRKFQDWPLVQKVRFVPVLCSELANSPDSYYQKSEQPLNEFGELVKIRNSIVHGGMVISRFAIEFGQDSQHNLSDNFPENFWAMTNFPKDIRSLSYTEARYTYSHVLGFARTMLEYLDGKVSLTFLRDEQLMHDGRKYSVQRETVTANVPRWCNILLGNMTP